ncbi:MAG TPA: hypothetical protein DEH78_24205 [Solibacterales bacterium]|nr:hypothetical protein [Bryobacterales bacterium]
MTLAEGTKLGPYQIVALIGTGGMGSVYRARDTRLSREVALKVIQHDAVKSGRERLLQEAQAASALSHPNIVTVLDIGSEGGVDYVAMELVSGQTLAALLARGAMPWREAARIGMAIAGAAAAAHALGIVHRDLKPGNVMVGDDGRVRLLDFGLAKVDPALFPAGDETKTMRLQTAAGAVLGTVSYMSPEQAEGKPVDARSDIFSFGAVLYEMLSGRQAFAGDSGASTWSAILRDDPAPIEGIPAAVRRVVARCLRKDRGQRFQHMADVRIAIEDALEEPSVSTVSAPAKRARRRWVPVVAALAAAGLLGGAYWLWKRATAAPPPYDMTQFTFDDGLTFAPSISADGKLIAYASDRAGDTGIDIWVQQTVGGSAIRLTQEPGDERDPSISPDGSTVVYRSDRDGGGLYAVPSLGGEARPLAPGGHDPRFSPDGTLIAYSTAPAGDGEFMGVRRSELWVMEPTGDRARRLHADFEVARRPVWAEDGRHLYFVGEPRRSGRPSPALYYSSLDASAPVKLDVLRRDSFSLAMWSPAHDRYLAGRRPDRNLWLVDPDPSKGRWARPPERLTLTSQRQDRPSVSTAGLIVFGEVAATIDLWEIDLSRPAAEPRRLTRDIAPKSSPQVSPDGKSVVYVTNQFGSPDVWTVDVESGKTRALTRTPAFENHPIFVDGGIAFGSRPIDGPPDHYVLPLGGGVPEKICERCGRLDDLTRDLRYVVFTGPPNDGVQLADRKTGKRVTLLNDPPRSLYQPRISQDGKWVVFVAKTSDLDGRIYAAPFRGAETIPVSEWLPLTEAGDDKPVLTEDNSGLYFTSLADGSRCLYFQKLNPATMKPAGSPVAVRHFHSNRLSLGGVSNAQLEISLAGGKLYLNLAETRGNIWLLQPFQNRDEPR